MADWEILYKQDLYLINMVGYSSHIFRDIYWGGGVWNFVYTTKPSFNKKLGCDISHIFKDIYWGGGLVNFVYTRRLVN